VTVTVAVPAAGQLEIGAGAVTGVVCAGGDTGATVVVGIDVVTG